MKDPESLNRVACKSCSASYPIIYGSIYPSRLEEEEFRSPLAKRGELLRSASCAVHNLRLLRGRVGVGVGARFGSWLWLGSEVGLGLRFGLGELTVEEGRPPAGE